MANACSVQCYWLPFEVEAPRTPATDLGVILEERVREIVAEIVGPQSPPSRYLAKEALAARLGVEPRTVKTWRSKGCPGIRVGREVMFEVAAVERWIETHG